MNNIYHKKGFVIIPVNNGFVVINTHGEFKENHTHLKHFNACKKAIDLVLNKKIPRSNSFYFLTSLYRLSIDEAYKKEIEELIKVKKSKGKQTYRNRG